MKKRRQSQDNRFHTALLLLSLSLLAGCGWLSSDEGGHSSTRREWAKDHVSKAKTQAQIAYCEQFLKNVLPSKQPVILAKCMTANGYSLKRVRNDDD